jgi:hypothetical protein
MTQQQNIHPSLSHLELPEHMKGLYMDDKGRPVPWFVQWLKDGKPCNAGEGAPDFRIMDGYKHFLAYTRGLCWVCGNQLGSRFVFVMGCMCGVNRTNPEPPSHFKCAEYSARACPFLTIPKMVRRESEIPEGYSEPGGVMIKRNPGVTLLWYTRSYDIIPTDRTALFRVGNPDQVRWFAEGREATRAEVMKSIETGLPLLEAACDQEPYPAARVLARRQLQKQYDAILPYLPRE